MASRKLIRLAPTLTLPLDAITQTFGIFGLKGSGKSSTGATFVEQGVAVGGRFVVADPTGVWWGLMHDGVGPGLPGIVFGGEHADVPLEPTAGHIVAEFVVQQDAYPVVVLDMKLMRKADRTKFMLDFLETLYHDNREALHVVLDEAGQFAPTQARDGGNTIPLLGAVEDVVALGRSRGLGITMISQRFATLNANVREQIGTLVAHQLVGSLDRKALKGWVEAQADPTREKEMVEGIAKLDVGRALVWSPAFLKFFGIVDINAPVTFDSRATPKVGQRVAKPGKRADVDLGVLRDRMAATIVEAEANDPKLLKKRLAEAQALARRQAAEIAAFSNVSTTEETGKMQREIERLERELAEALAKPVISDKQIKQIESMIARAEKAAEKMGGAWEEVRGVMYPLASNVRDALQEQDRARARAQARPAAPPRARTPTQRTPQPRSTDAGEATRSAPEAAPDTGASGGATFNGKVTNPEQRVLDALAWFEALGMSPVTRAQVGAIARYSHSSGGFKNLLSALRSKRGFVEYPSEGMVMLTDDGRAHAAVADVERTAEGLQQAVLARLSNPQAKVLRVLLDAYPETLTRQEIGERAVYEPTSGGFKNLLSALRSTFEVIEYPSQGEARACDWLFEVYG